MLSSLLHPLAVDIGGSTWSLGTWDDSFGLQIVQEGIIGSQDPAELSELRSAVRRWSTNCRSIGVSFAGSVDPTGIVTDWPNRRHWIGAHLPMTLGLDEDMRLYVMDDGWAALNGEAVLGIGADMGDLLVVTMGTGLGGGVRLSGRAYAGIPGDARTIGHLRALPSLLPCPCGGQGCLQTSLTSLPSDDVLDYDGSAAWPDGDALLNVLADVAHLMGIGDVVVTGGLLHRPVLRHHVAANLAARGSRCHIPAQPGRSSLLGALIRQEAAL